MLGDAGTIKRIKEGDIKAFEQLFRLYYSPLCLYAASITGQMHIAEDIVQDLFYTCWKERKRLHIFHSLNSYLYAAVRNRALQHCEHQEVRSRHRAAVLSAAGHTKDADPQDMLEYNELNELINRTLDKLPERRMRIFKMHRYEGKKYAEIAAELALSVKTVEAEMTKALQMLRKAIENYTRIA